MLDLTQRRTTGSAVVAALTVKRAGRGEGAVAVRLDLAVPVADEEAAEVLDQIVPGSLALFRRRSIGSEDRARLNRSPSDLTVVAALRDPKSPDDVPVLSVMAAVERLSFVSSPKFVHAIYRLRIVVDPSLLGAIAAYLEREVEVSLSTPQQVLPFVRSEPKPAEADPAGTEEREIVSFEVAARSSAEQVVYGFGEVLDETPDEILVSDFGVEAAVQVEHIVARVPLLASSAVLETYEVGCRAVGRSATWADLITALGVDWATSAESGEPLQLRDDHVRSVLGADGEAGGA